MSCVTSTAKRRRRQAVGGWKNLSKQRRPRYAKHTTEVWDRRAVAARERRLMMEARKGRKKK
jgi:hypothetical protein